LQCLEVVLGEEGGTANHKNDRGGLTNRGVTQKTYDKYRVELGFMPRPVTQIEDSEVEDIYEEYWIQCHADDMPEPLDLYVFDCSINSGPTKAISLLQRTVGLEEVGNFGPKTRAAVAKAIEEDMVDDLADRYLDTRIQFYRNIVSRDPSQAVFLNGWLNRIGNLREVG
jgi:lysozyme family protein